MKAFRISFTITNIGRINLCSPIDKCMQINSIENGNSPLRRGAQMTIHNMMDRRARKTVAFHCRRPRRSICCPTSSRRRRRVQQPRQCHVSRPALVAIVMKQPALRMAMVRDHWFRWPMGRRTVVWNQRLDWIDRSRTGIFAKSTVAPVSVAWSNGVFVWP